MAGLSAPWPAMGELAGEEGEGEREVWCAAAGGTRGGMGRGVGAQSRVCLLLAARVLYVRRRKK
jgi:hypothetical protein